MKNHDFAVLPQNRQSITMADSNNEWTPSPSSDGDSSYFSYERTYASSESTVQTGQGSQSNSFHSENLQAGSTKSYSLDQSSHVSYDVNHNLKSSLTELLNSQAVREDEKIRVWAQTRLLEAERELRRQRRRRAVPTIQVSLDGED